MSTATVNPPRGQQPPPADAVGRLRVAVHGGDTLTRAGLRAVMGTFVDVEVERPADLAQSDVVVVALESVTPRALDAVRRLATHVGCRPVLIVGEVVEADAALLTQAGAVGVLRRRDVTTEAVGALLHAASLQDDEAAPPEPPVADPRTAGTTGPTATGDATGTPPSVTARERAVLRLLGEGADTREIARRLSYSERTVKVVVQDVTRRFGLRNRTHAVAYAVRHGLI